MKSTAKNQGRTLCRSGLGSPIGRGRHKEAWVRRVCFVAMIGMGLVAGFDRALAKKASGDEKLAPALQRQVDNGLALAWERQAWGGVFEQGADILQRGGTEATNSYLKSLQKPTIEEILATAWLRLNQSGLPIPLRLPAQGEACVATLEGVTKTLRQTVAGIEPVLEQYRKKIRGANLDALEDLQWELTATARLAEESANACDAAIKLLGQANKVNKRILSNERRASIRNDLDQTRQLWEAMQGQITEVGDELRVARLERVANDLQQVETAGQAGLKARFRAAFVLEQDGPELARMLETGATEGPESRKIQRAEKVQRLLSRVESQLDPEFRERAKNAYEGLVWWKRGRYGESTEFQGLVKPLNAMAKPAQMVVLEMPRDRIRPTDPCQFAAESRPGGSIPSPRYARRHFHLWQITAQEVTQSAAFLRGSKYIESHEPLGYF